MNIDRSKRKVVESDFRLPQYIDANVDDYEFRQDGALVRKDRWQCGIQSIAVELGISRDYEIDDLVERVRILIHNDKVVV